MTTREEVIAYCKQFKHAYEDYPFKDNNWTTMRRSDNQRVFAWIFERMGYIWVNVKADPEWRDVWRGTYRAVVPAFHLNKTHWNSLILDGTIPEQEIERMIDESYDLCGHKQNK